jgi:hypothetical protein
LLVSVPEQYANTKGEAVVHHRTLEVPVYNFYDEPERTEQYQGVLYKIKSSEGNLTRFWTLQQAQQVAMITYLVIHYEDQRYRSPQMGFYMVISGNGLQLASQELHLVLPERYRRAPSRRAVKLEPELAAGRLNGIIERMQNCTFLTFAELTPQNMTSLTERFLGECRDWESEMHRAVRNSAGLGYIGSDYRGLNQYVRDDYVGDLFSKIAGPINEHVLRPVGKNVLMPIGEKVEMSAEAICKWLWCEGVED